jgi:cytochrome c biogenesis protein CcmG/thiol:disulfide interchange protein DsbE
MGHRLQVLRAAAIAGAAGIAAAVAGCAVGASAGAGVGVGPVGVGVGAGAGGGVGAESPGDATSGALPPVPVATLAGEPAHLAALTEGRVALVSLWATWCDACDKEMDALNRLHESTAAGRDAVVIGVAVGEDRAKVAAFTRQRGLRYAQLVDEHYAFADALGQRRLPATLVVDRHGRIVYRGEALDARGLDAFRRAIGVQPPPPGVGAPLPSVSLRP